MRLLCNDGSGGFSLTEDFISDPPRYAILSHTWQIDGGEVTYKDMIDDTANDKPGYAKIRFCGERALRDGLRYFWVDSCCIDKSNSTELTEAINSMFRWYENAEKCYVYLSDVPALGVEDDTEYYQQAWKTCFRNSRWFTRGWTLQELLAPKRVEFFSKHGEPLGSKKSLEWQLHEITGVPIRALQGEHLRYFSIEERLSWAEARVTTREEDKFYSLLGIFGVVMPPIYGEGRRNASKRLRHEINKITVSMLPAETIQEQVRPRIQNSNIESDRSDKAVWNIHQFNSDSEQKDSSQLRLKMSNEKILQDSASHKFWLPRFSKARLVTLTLVVPLILIIFVTIVSQLKDTPQVKEQTWSPAWPIFAVIGRTGTGKSSFIKTVGGREVNTTAFPIVADSSVPCTLQIMWYNTMVDGEPIILIDTPGFDDGILHDQIILELLWNDFNRLALLKDRHLSGIIFLHDGSPTVFSGPTAATMDKLQNLLGHDDFYRLAIVTSDWTKNIHQKPFYSWFGKRKPPQEPEDQLSELTQAGAETIYYDGSLDGATAIIKQLLANRYKKRWDGKPRTPIRLFDPSKDSITVHTLPMPEPTTTTAAQDVPLVSGLFTMPLDARGRNWIARMLRLSPVARAVYLLILLSFYLVALPYAVKFDESNAPVFSTLIFGTWLVYDAFSTAGNGSRFPVVVLCIDWVDFFAMQEAGWKIKDMKTGIETLVSVLLSCVTAYTVYDWISEIQI